ncbi:hypothetical protein A3K24_02765 [candidate division Kazan bacterium RIFCSPHIGHO2_01_FULL_44_14]|uniref:Uncharacterized protein n=1 Tax=candidate division Kazan bacterium RIFCSPLOWO2_01_FULL_45_19 TaxID=1798538 RepID=A0A1F4NQP7_UNCK3|nr:hypothetical protein [uncultured bacterium]AQS31153.1 hypothetical protein [uncultured bacterium]OGB73731.1 MAG: hypothetical protein A3K51_02765 [candidate division Kazan bacterium RIFCSPLOWO2_01_FULL_45_19]OGB77976.1 MAG: hypothetical protein A3K24_02765 [candidate division Kazan bacterium RIFCSPHIGHO2_01_FULL_44_14]
MQKIGPWFWNNRKSLITTALFGALLELLFIFPTYLVWWVVGLAIILTMGVWWLAGFGRDIQKWWWLWAESIWVTAGGIGLVIFSLLNIWQFQIVTLLILLVMFGIFKFYNQYFQDNTWPVRSFSLLSFLNLVAFFATGASWLMAAEFYNLDSGWLMLGYLAQVVLAINLRFWREGVMSVRRWFYILVTALVLEEALWVISSWHRGVYLKAFLLAMIFYVFMDFILHYSRGTLTVKVVVEYASLIAFLLVTIFVFDWLLILQ